MFKNKIIKKRKKPKIKDKKTKSHFLNLFLRYFLLIFLGFSLPIFYSVFAPPNLFLLKKTLSLFFDIKIVGNFLYGPSVIEIIPACVGASAYYLLLILNLTTPKVKAKKRLASIVSMFLMFFIFNFLRLFFLIFLEFKGMNTYFYHKFLWYFGSTIFVFIIWILNIKLFKIKEIPVISDVAYIKNLSK